MYKSCKTEQSALRQRQIEEALLDLMAVRRYDDITVSELCQTLDMPRKAFYRYFSSKEGALMALLDHRLMEYDSGDRPGKKQGTYRFTLDLEWFFEFWMGQKKLLDALAHSGISGILVERAIRNSQEAMIFEIPEQSRAYVNAATSFTVCGLMSMALSWYQNGYSESVQEMARLSRRLLSRPLVPGLEP